MNVMKSAQCIEEMQAIAKMIDEENGAGAADEMFTFVFSFTFRLAQNWWGLLGAERKRRCGGEKMSYKELIHEMIDQIADERFLRQVYTIVAIHLRRKSA